MSKTRDERRHILLKDIVKETPSASISRTSSPQEQHHQHPTIVSHHNTGPNRLVSHVDVDSFDPTGVQELRQNLSKHDENEHERHSTISSDSDRTLQVRENEPLHIEKMTRRIVKKHIISKDGQSELGSKVYEYTGVTTANSYIPTLGSLLNPKVILENIPNARYPSLHDILSGCEGVVKPGEMLLVLGSPGSGCSTLLKALANRRKGYKSVEGDVHYDSITPEDLYKHFRGDVLYCPEDDVHFPSLSVGDTLSFAAAAHAPSVRADASRKDFTNNITTLLATILELRHTLTTPVGDNAICGVGGGEKRIIIAEVLASRTRVGAWDNKAKQHFMDMGYEPANRQTTTDFPVTVTDPNARIPRAGFTNQPQRILMCALFIHYQLLAQFVQRPAL